MSKIPIWLITRGTVTKGGIIYFTTDTGHVERTESLIHKCYKNHAFGHVHLNDAIVYWCRVDELKPGIFK